MRSIRLRESADFLALDAGTIRHLALLPGDGVVREASLLGVLNVTRTPMGARRLAGWIRQPLRRADAVNARLDAVEAFVKDRIGLSTLRERLGGVRDLERLIAKVDSGRANARDLRALAASLRPVADVKGELETAAALVADIRDRLSPEADIVALIDRAICEQPNVILTEGNLIAPGYSAELDELRQMAAAGHQWIAEYQASEIARTGIKTLRVRRNSVFGFYIEISKAAAVAAPPEYERRQTLTNAERFTTPELREYERKVMGAQERSYALEADLFRDIVAQVALRTAPIQQTAAALGELDAILSLADRALAAGYVRPSVDESDVLEIADGRHPIIEQLPDAEPFVPNGTKLNGTTDQIMLITGPNMAGKSTYLRQVATTAIMAQAGSFVPASSMRLGALDRVFTRIGAGDDLARGRSTFLVEMQESANILNNATPRSLIVLDEIGRGTSTFDGISIAWSVAEYLHENPKVKAKTLFATHYHELTDLAEKFKGIKNYTVRVKEDGDRVVFLRRIAPGVAERSFGIHVAAMAGLPRAVVDRADQILKNLEANDLDVNAPKVVRRPRKKLSDLPGQSVSPCRQDDAKTFMENHQNKNKRRRQEIMDNLAQALKELGQKNGFNLALDDNGTCSLELADGRPLILQERVNLNELDFVALLGEVPDAAHADVFRELLAANFYWEKTLGATLSWNADLEQVVLIYPLPLADATSKTIESIFTRFLELQAAWKERLDGLVAEASVRAETGDDAEANALAENDHMVITP